MTAYKILIFTVSIIVVLCLLSLLYPKDGVAIGGKHYFFPSLEEVLVKEESKTAFEKKQILEAQIAFNDSVKTVYEDSLRFFNDFFQNHPSRFYFPNDDLHFFDTLFYTLDSVAPFETVHILHYGDSQIESDRLTGFLRQQFQQRFGGNGPGLLPIVQPIPSLTVSQQSSGSLSRFIISGNHSRKASHNRYGILGQMSELNGSATLSISPRKAKEPFENLQTFSKIRLFVDGNSSSFQAKLSSKPSLPANAGTVSASDASVKTYTWNLSEPVGHINLQISGKAELTAISLDGQTGVAVDNIPLRGSSGTFFVDIAKESIIPVLKELRVALVILEFGGNSVPSINGEKSIEYYKKSISRQIARWHELAPDAKILFIGPSDMATKRRGELQTYPLLPQIVAALKEAALENGAAYWDMYEAMGGFNSMREWVKQKPPLASPDYIHFTLRGVDRVADMLFRSLMMYRDYYSFNKSVNISK